jgi:hypothetical protein
MLRQIEVAPKPISSDYFCHSNRMENIRLPWFFLFFYVLLQKHQKPYGSIFSLQRQRLITDTEVVLCILEQLPYFLSISISVITAWFIFKNNSKMWIILVDFHWKVIYFESNYVISSRIFLLVYFRLKPQSKVSRNPFSLWLLYICSI